MKGRLHSLRVAPGLFAAFMIMGATGVVGQDASDAASSTNAVNGVSFTSDRRPMSLGPFTWSHPATGGAV